MSKPGISQCTCDYWLSIIEEDREVPCVLERITSRVHLNANNICISVCHYWLSIIGVRSLSAMCLRKNITRSIHTICMEHDKTDTVSFSPLFWEIWLIFIGVFLCTCILQNCFVPACIHTPRSNWECLQLWIFNTIFNEGLYNGA